MSSRTNNVINQILAYIRQNKLVPGDPMPSEFELINKLGVSRSTLREAIRELRTLQIVEVRHGYGSFVGQASLSFLSEALVFRAMAPGRPVEVAMEELITIREILEVGLASDVAGKLSDSQLKRLRECTDAMVENADNSEADRKFHAILYENVENEIIKQLISAFWDAFDAIKLDLSDEGINATRRIHEDIIDAYTSGDIFKAREAMRDHFSYIKQRLSQL